MSPTADPHSPAPHRVAALLAAVAITLAAAALTVGAGTGVSRAATPPPAESWSAELALDGGDDTGVQLDGGAVHLTDPATPARGVLTLAPRRLTTTRANTITGVLTADEPPDTTVTVQARGIRTDGTWSPWNTLPPEGPTRLEQPTLEIQLRLLLTGPHTASERPVVHGLWITATLTPPAPTPCPCTTHTTPATTTAVTTTPVTTTPVTTTPVTTTPVTTTPVATTPVTTTPVTTTPVTTTPVTTTPVTTRPSVPPTTNPSPLWTSDIAARGLGQFKNTPYNITPGASVRLVDGPPRAIRFSVPAGATRAEIEPNINELSEGQHRFFRLTYALPATFPVNNTRGFQLVTQWKNTGTGSPPVELRVEGGRFVLGGGYGYPSGPRLFRTDVAPAVPGRTVTVVVGITFSTDPRKGSVDVWVDGTRRITAFQPPGGTLYPGTRSYWKIGLYRDPALKTSAVADLLQASLGTSYDSVAQ
jgi:hypothetical protein